MMARRGVIGVLAAVVGAAALWRCSSKNSLRYKMVVEVDTPEGVKSGFAVREMGLSTDNIMRPTTGSLKGEAVVVDLPGGQTLFVLLTGGDGDVDYAMQIGGRAGVWESSGPVELYPVAPRTVGLQHTDPLPMLVRFGDARDPKSVERVEPGALGKVFGSGVRLRRIAIEATSEPVTMGIEKSLKWLDHLDDYRSDKSNPFTSKLPSEISGLRGR